MRGPLAGKSLTILPSVVTTWGDWKKRYPTTTAVLMSRTADVYRRSGADPHMGLCLAIERNGDAIAFDFADLARHLAIQHTIADTPILVSFDRQSFTAAAFDRRLDGRILSFEVQDDHIIESATASRLDPVSGSFVDGPLQGKSLSAIPSMIADPATWSLFHPDGLLWRAPHNPPHDLPAVPR
ncbi:MAG: hypothetical protein KatS3mg110_3577 [Pirellulaceae bacterium]|nr:MAG: hypothetical protein KatS3mg110_3577 [Pirellulaceae bacterium]